jgi:hypothetical protein
MAVGAALDVTGRCSYLIIPTLADFLCCLRKAETATISVFIGHIELIPPPLETGKMNTVNQKETRKGDQQILVCQGFEKLQGEIRIHQVAKLSCLQ